MLHVKNMSYLLPKLTKQRHMNISHFTKNHRAKFKSIFISFSLLLLCPLIAFGVHAISLSNQDTKRVQKYCEPLINLPINLSKQGTQEFKFSRKYDECMFATAFLDCDSKTTISPLPELFGSAQVLDAERKIIKSINLTEDCLALGFPTIRLSKSMYFPLLNLPDESGDYILQLELTAPTKNIPTAPLYLKACYMTSMPIHFNASVHMLIAIIAFSIAGLITLILLVLTIGKKIYFLIAQKSSQN